MVCPARKTATRARKAAKMIAAPGLTNCYIVKAKFGVDFGFG